MHERRLDYRSANGVELPRRRRTGAAVFGAVIGFLVAGILGCVTFVALLPRAGMEQVRVLGYAIFGIPIAMLLGAVLGAVLLERVSIVERSHCNGDSRGKGRAAAGADDDIHERS